VPLICPTVASCAVTSAMAFEKIKVANPIVEMDGKIPSLTDTIPIAPSRLCC
jgi:hypothetical protein